MTRAGATCRYAVWLGGRAFRIDEAPVPEPGPGEVRVRIRACGVCLSEVHFTEGYFDVMGLPNRFGHEISGVIEALGPGVGSLKVGMPVASLGPNFGGYAEHIVGPAGDFYPIPDAVAVEHASFIEPLGCCTAAVQKARLPVGATVLITGTGTMGLLVLQLARRSGAAHTLVSEPNPTRRALALQLGADHAIDPAEVAVPRAVKELTRGAGVDVAFEMAGHPTPLADCLHAVADGGTIVLVGVNRDTATLDLPLYQFLTRNLTLIGSCGGQAFTKQAINWLGQLDLESLISHRFELAEIGTAFDIARKGEGVKVLVCPGLAAHSAQTVS